MKKTVSIKIEVDLESKASKEWTNPQHYFESEVDDVLDKLSSIRKREYSKYSSEQGTTENGSKFKIVVKKTTTQ